MKFCFILYCVLISVTATAQLEEGVLAPPVDLNNFTPSELKDFYADISIETFLPPAYTLPFSSVRVIDCRQDTFKIGFIPANPYKEGPESYECILVEKGLRHSLETILNERYKSSFSSDSLRLLVVVKRFWADPFPNRKIQKEQKSEKVSLFDLHLCFEFFFEKDNWCYPVKRVDTLLQSIKGYSLPECDDNTLKDCKIYGHAIAKVFESIDFDFYAQHIHKMKNKLTKQMLDSITDHYAHYAIAKDSLLQKGVYLSFEEFRNNTPGIKNYKKDVLSGRSGKMLVLYNMENEQKERIVKYWGYCDGENIFSKFTPYPLSKFGNTFEFFVNKEDYTTDFLRFSSPLYITPGKTTTMFNLFNTAFNVFLYYSQAVYDKPVWNKAEPMQLDMETGRIY